MYIIKIKILHILHNKVNLTKLVFLFIHSFINSFIIFIINLREKH